MPVETVIESGLFRDPGVQCQHCRYRKTNEALKPSYTMGMDTSEDDSIVQKWDWIFERLWYGGHIFVMMSSMLSILTCLTRQVLKPWPRLLYRSTFVCAALTYTLSILKFLNGAEPGFFSLLPLPTFQYIIISVLWAFTVPHTIKLVPFALYSLLHSADTASVYHSTSKSHSRIFQGLSDNLAPKIVRLNGYLDIWLMTELFRDCVLVRPGAVVSLMVYGFFYRVKLLFLPSSQDAALQCYRSIDKYLTRQDCPRRIRTLWVRLRNRFRAEELQSSGLHREDTEKAIERANMFHEGI